LNSNNDSENSNQKKKNPYKNKFEQYIISASGEDIKAYYNCMLLNGALKYRSKTDIAPFNNNIIILYVILGLVRVPILI